MKEAVNTYHPMMGRVFADEENKVLGLCSGLDSDGQPKFIFQILLSEFRPVARMMPKSFDTLKLADELERRIYFSIIAKSYAGIEEDIHCNGKALYEAGTVLRTEGLDRERFLVPFNDIGTDRLDDLKFCVALWYCDNQRLSKKPKGNNIRLVPANEEETARAYLGLDRYHYFLAWGTPYEKSLTKEEMDVIWENLEL